ncbi:MAG TPA: VOC family protein [Gemmatimonadaceae bacterium]|jgi:methylmalonyl-CoA/ethylmalonyl-CoA epimerase
MTELKVVVPSLDRVGQIAINVHDVDRATTFYRDVLGMKFLFAAPPGLAFLDCGGVRLMLTTPESAQHASMSSVIYYVVPDVAEAHRSLVTRGVVFEDEPHIVARMGTIALWMVSLRDTEGNLLALMCEKNV